MATDWWPTQEGRIVDGLTLNCIAEDGDIVEGQSVTWGTSTSGQITVDGSSGLGDGWGIALNASAAAGDAVAVLVYGLYKLTVSNATGQPAQGEFCMSSGGTYITSIQDCGFTVDTLVATDAAGSSYLLGMAMQSATANSDDIVVFIGKAP
jgi:predicted RecA/RadA family phage recombinase